MGSYELLVWLIRTSGAAERGPSAEHLGDWCGLPCCAAFCSRPQPLTASAPAGASAARQTRRGGPRVRAPGTRAIPASGQREDEVPEASAVNDAAVAAYRLSVQAGNPLSERGSPRCSDAHPAAGREPESPMHGKHRRSQTRRVPRSRLTRKQGPSAVSPERDLTAPGRSGIGAWRSARSALCVNLDAMRVKGLAWLGIPAGDYAAGPVLRRDPGPGSCLRCGEHRGTYRRERRQDPAIRPRPPLLRVLPKPRRQHRPAARGGRPGSGDAELARGGAELLGGPESDGT